MGRRKTVAQRAWEAKRRGRQRRDYAKVEAGKKAAQRVSLMHCLRDVLRGEGMPVFGPGEPFCLLLIKDRIGYWSSDDDDCDWIDMLDQENWSEGKLRSYLRYQSRTWSEGRDDDEVEVPFVQTIYVEGGGKFTIGNKFVGRESQGEFVYWDPHYNPYHRRGDPETPLLEEVNYFTLECEDGVMWISSTGSCPLAVVSVNGVTLESGNHASTSSKSSRRPLEFGDFVSISLYKGKKEEGPALYDFIFKAARRHSNTKVKILKRSSIDNDNNTQEQDMLMRLITFPKILENILEALTTEKVKDFRHVSHHWNREALKVLKDRVKVTIYQNYRSTTNTEISDYIHSQLNELKFPHWKIELPGARNFVNDREGTNHAQRRMFNLRDAKIVDDLKWLMASEQNVESLQVFGTGVNQEILNILLALLCGVKRTLTTLHLDVKDDFEPLSPSALDAVSGIKSLFLRMMHSGSYRFPPAATTGFLESFLPAVKNIQTLSFRYGSKSAIPLSSLVLEEISTLQEDRLVYLTEIIIPACADEHLKAIANLRKGSLKTLKLSDLNPNGPQRRWSRSSQCRKIKELRPALDRHSNSLDNLSLTFALPSSVTKNLIINFPHAMPKLKSLSIILELTDRATYTVHCKFGRRGGQVSRLDYESRFPSLSKLTVEPAGTWVGRCCWRDKYIDGQSSVGWGTFLPAMTAFLETTGPIPSIQVLNIPFRMQGKYHPVLDNLEDTFPSVTFPRGLAEAREGPVWNPEDAEVVEEEENSEDEDDSDGDASNSSHDSC